MSDEASTKIAIITDTHYWARREPVYTSEGALQLQPWSQQILTTLMAEVQAAQVDLILHLGDQVCVGGGYAMPNSSSFTGAAHPGQIFFFVSSICRRSRLPKMSSPSPPPSSAAATAAGFRVLGRAGAAEVPPAAGTGTRPPHCRHFNALPAAASGAFKTV